MESSFAQAKFLQQAREFDQAAVVCREYLQQQPNHAEAWHLLGILALQRNSFQEAADSIEKALAIEPHDAIFHFNIAAAYRVLGRFEESEVHYRTTIRSEPDFVAEAYFNLSFVRHFEAEDPVIEAIGELLRQPNLSGEDRCFLHFASGKIYDDLGEFDTAFDHFQRGNAAKRMTFDPGEHDRFIEKMISTLDGATLKALSRQGSSSDLAIFIVGMPRSGTTLLEQILASHPDVFGAGELQDIMDIANTLPQYAPGGSAYPDCLPSLRAEVFRGAGDAYSNNIRRLASNSKRIVDKYPQNHHHLGLISLLLPRARIIHSRRNPLDTCLSCYFQNFRGGQEFSYDWGHLGSYYRAYERLMDHWHRVLPIEILDVDYESLVNDPEETSRKMIDFCGLDWDDRCLRPNELDRPVRTSSNWQVRQPIFRSALHRWRNYEAHLGPLREALGKGP